MDKTAAALKRRMEAAERMQSGVAQDLKDRPNSDSIKHLRVGVNSALVDHTGLAVLLIKKGLITEEEYFTSLGDSMEAEVERYEKLLSERHGQPVKLGRAGHGPKMDA